MQRVVYSSRDLRSDALCGVCRRLSESEANRGGAQTIEISAALATLRARGCLSEDDRGLWYSPSWRVRQSVYDEGASNIWPDRVVKKQRASMRTVSGALFRFPLIGGGEETIEAFITDWSPFPAAAALAVHPDHPLARSPKCPGSYFTGRYAWHPLTGDQLPVWVAPWVKSTFGTGAVIVNPGHSAIDLEFARAVGLPVRFALTLQRPTVDPATWPKAPVVKTGVTTRTGEFDGLEVPAATERYFAELARGGWAERFVDRNVDSILISTADGAPTELLHVLLSVDPRQPFHLFWPSAEVESSMLYARTLWRDLYEQPFTPALVQLYQRVEQTKLETKHPDLVALIAGPLDQVGVVKKHMPEQAERFYEGHSQLVESPVEGEAALELREALSLLREYQFHLAFQKLHAWQKQAIKAGRHAPREYFDLVFLLTGIPHPNAESVFTHASDRL